VLYDPTSYMTHGEDVHIDASAFQRPLETLAEVLSQKVKREASKLVPMPRFVAFDLHVLVRQAQYTYNLLFYLNADDRLKNDCYWRPAYSVVAFPLIRNMIDCLYNITAILQKPQVNGPRFRRYGIQKVLKGFDEDQQKYGGKQEWDEWIAKGRDVTDFDLRNMGFTVAEVMAEKEWPTLGKYINQKQPGGTFTPHQEFLRSFVYGPWREYSAMAHGGADGLLKTAIFYIVDSLPHEERPKLDDGYQRMLGTHLSQASAVLLCTVTELQAYFHFDGADINKRIHHVWNALKPTFVAKELYDERYKKLMSDAGINP
jgi:hypothetical protein